MSLYELDDLLTTSIALIRASTLDDAQKRQLVWNLEQLPNRYELDAGGFDKSEEDQCFDYAPIAPLDLCLQMMTEAQKQKKRALVYDWSAFVLIWGPGYFDDFEDKEKVKQGPLLEMKSIFSSHDFKNHEPAHRSLDLQTGLEYDETGLVEWFQGEGA